MKKLLFSVSVNDCEQQFFTCGGKGGSGKDTSNNGVRLIHKPSGASAEARDTRSQKTNRRAAWLKLVKSKKFLAWHKIEVARRMGKRPVEEVVNEMMEVKNLLVEYQKEDGTFGRIAETV